ncbi:MAG: rhodanese-like domain-containing protein [Prevotella sp.]|nr:rhodanese-like domain-containing protein [Prevotella sp.]
MKRFLAFILAALGLNIACSQNFENTDVKGFAELIDSADVVILDVRTTDEFSEGHIKGAILIDQNKSDFLELVRQLLPKEKTIAIYCRSGRRSANAAERLVKEGYKPVNLKGGILEWKKENMPVTKE